MCYQIKFLPTEMLCSGRVCTRVTDCSKCRTKSSRDMTSPFRSLRRTSRVRALDKGLEGLRVFFYPRHQEETAGTDGLESMRKPFLDCRVMVVLYREGGEKRRGPAWKRTPSRTAVSAPNFGI
jgi:hypothetical protein